MPIDDVKISGGFSRVDDSPVAPARNTTEALVAGLLKGEDSAHPGSIKDQFSLAVTSVQAPAMRANNGSLGRPAYLEISNLFESWQCRPYAEVPSRIETPIALPAGQTRHPASYNFFRQRNFKIRSWADQDLRTLPLADIFRTEAAHLHSHAPLYHATRVGHWALNHLATRSIKAANPDTELGSQFWLRNPADPQIKLPRLASVGDMRAYLEDVGVSLAAGIDNKKGISHAFLSCNPSIMQNSAVSSEECSADFYYANISVNRADSLGHIETLLGTLNPDIADDEIKQLAATVSDAITSELQSDRGVLYQFLIPFSQVRDLTYISGQNGVPNAAHPDPLETLLQLQTDQAPLMPDAEALQVRLYLYPLMDLTHRQDTRLNVYHELTGLQTAAFDRRIDPVIERLLSQT